MCLSCPSRALNKLSALAGMNIFAYPPTYYATYITYTTYNYIF